MYRHLQEIRDRDCEKIIQQSFSHSKAHFFFKTIRLFYIVFIRDARNRRKNCLGSSLQSTFIKLHRPFIFNIYVLKCFISLEIFVVTAIKKFQLIKKCHFVHHSYSKYMQACVVRLLGWIVFKIICLSVGHCI